MQHMGKYQKIVEKQLPAMTRRRYYYEVILSGIRILFSEGPFVLSRRVVNKLRGDLTKKINCQSTSHLGSYSSTESRQSSKIFPGGISKVISNRSYYIKTKNGADFDQKAIGEVLHSITSELKKELQ